MALSVVEPIIRKPQTGLQRRLDSIVILIICIITL